MTADRDLDRLLAFAHGLLDETDAIALTHFRSGVSPERKPDRTLVTAADTEVERVIRSRIAGAHPAHGVIGEEFGDEAADAEVAWIVDPVDATHNFVRGIGVWATLLACRIGGEPAVGLVSAPAMGARWWAALPGEAWVRDEAGTRRIGVSGVDRLADGQFLYGDARALGGRAVVAAGRAWRSRGFGDFWSHMLVASGSAEAMVEDGVHPYDLAAPYVIVTAAGGRMTDL
ncbi:MAG: histidinol-phosphatase, partial [Chloroflexi bacterium]|nr:histidinol-phosphatase [Chloroflexota bacterium]